MEGAVTATGGVFSASQITSITSALTQALNNTLAMFVSLLPIFALICGAAFGIRFVKGLFNRTANTK